MLKIYLHLGLSVQLYSVVVINRKFAGEEEEVYQILIRSGAGWWCGGVLVLSQTRVVYTVGGKREQ